MLSRVKYLKDYHININSKDLYNKLSKKLDCLDTEMKLSIVEETAGGLSASAFVGAFALAGGGIAIFAHPAVGSIVMVFSLVCGSIMKVYAGRVYTRNKIKHNTKKNFEIKIKELFDSDKIVECNFRKTATSKYALVRLLSRPKKIMPQ